mgnify:CR=1 FL=1
MSADGSNHAITYRASTAITYRASTEARDKLVRAARRAGTSRTALLEAVMLLQIEDLALHPKIVRLAERVEDERRARPWENRRH